MHSSLNFSSANLSFDKRPLRNLSDICKKSCSEDSRGTSALFFVALAEEAVVTTHSFTEMLRTVSIEDLKLPVMWPLQRIFTFLTWIVSLYLAKIPSFAFMPNFVGA